MTADPGLSVKALTAASHCTWVEKPRWLSGKVAFSRESRGSFPAVPGGVIPGT